ncbi:hypothetical protein OESDEN_13570, partial [Oesophagostomum dentatum]
MSDGFSNPSLEKNNSFIDQHLSGQGRSVCLGRGTGKRFARRAKRWAELQQRRYNQRLVAIRSEFLGSSEPRSCVYTSFDLQDTLGMMKAGDVLECGPNLDDARQSTLSCWISQPYCQDLSGHYSISSLETSLFMSTATVKYAPHRNLCQFDSDAKSSHTPSQRPPNHTSNQRTLVSYPDLADLLSHVRTNSPVTTTSTSISVRDSNSYVDRFSLRLPPSSRIPGEEMIATFTVLCYNVLCDKYATVNQYSYCPSWALNWEYRKMSIMKEIRNYEADIITLQEVETEQFRLLFQPELKALGYTGIFSPKSRAKTMNEEDRKYVDGCAIFWKSEKFEMEREHLIEFTQVVVKKASTSEHMLNRVMPRDNIALCAVLRIKENVYNNRRMTMAATDNVVGSPLVVCTAHIHWDPELCDVKLVQTMMLAHELFRLLEEVAEQFRITPQQTPVLICGDLNSLPDS